MKTLRFFLLSVSVIAFFASCKKDPNTLVAKSWKATSIKVDGQEQLNITISEPQQTFFAPNCNLDYTYSNSYKLKTYLMDIKEGGNFTHSETVDFTNIDFTATDNNCALTMTTSSYSYTPSGTWSVASDGKQITLIYSENGISTTYIYDIVELKRKSMKWKIIQNSKTYEYAYVLN